MYTDLERKHNWITLLKEHQIEIYSKGGDEYLPSYQTKGSSGLDLKAFIDEPLFIGPGEWLAVPTGIHVNLPNDYELQVRPRSGLAYNKGVTVLNSPGTIDDDYVGEIKVILINHGSTTFTVYNGDRIAQIVLAKVEKLNWITKQNTDSFISKDREGGFGSTGV